MQLYVFDKVHIWTSHGYTQNKFSFYPRCEQTYWSRKKHALIKQTKDYCPCCDYQNHRVWQDPDTIRSHLVRRGFRKKLHGSETPWRETYRTNQPRRNYRRSRGCGRCCRWVLWCQSCYDWWWYRRLSLWSWCREAGGGEGDGRTTMTMKTSWVTCCSHCCRIATKDYGRAKWFGDVKESEEGTFVWWVKGTWEKMVIAMFHAWLVDPIG